MNPTYGYRIINTENIELKPNAATTVYAYGDWLTPDGTGAYIPAAATQKLAGVCLENITSSDPRYTTPALFYTDFSLEIDTFTIPVTTGTAIASMVGSTFDLDTPQSLDVSAPGTQFEILQILSTTLVVVRVVLTV